MAIEIKTIYLYQRYEFDVDKEMTLLTIENSSNRATMGVIR